MASETISQPQHVSRRDGKGSKGVPTPVRYVLSVRNAGWPQGRELYAHGVVVVVVGITTHQGGWESQPQGEGQQVDAVSKGKE